MGQLISKTGLMLDVYSKKYPNLFNSIWWDFLFKCIIGTPKQSKAREAVVYHASQDRAVPEESCGCLYAYRGYPEFNNFKCHNGILKDKVSRRNSSTHCKDGSDETKCACGETSSPSHMCQFRDQPGTDPLSLSNSGEVSRHNGTTHGKYGSDETKCACGETSSPSHMCQFRDQPGTDPLSLSNSGEVSRHNGTTHGKYGSDETKCACGETSSPSHMCQFRDQPGTDPLSLSNSGEVSRRNSSTHCKDGSDETKCECGETSSPSHLCQFRDQPGTDPLSLSNSGEVSRRNSSTHCKDGSDETKCECGETSSPSHLCQFRDQPGTDPLSLSNSGEVSRRNGSTHCKDGSDETKCACGETSRPSHMCQFRDQPGTDPLSLSNSGEVSRRNSSTHCKDGSDETKCECGETSSPSHLCQFRDQPGTDPLSLSNSGEVSRRNGSTHCKDGSDETKCACGETSSPSHMCQFRDQPGTDLLTLSNSGEVSRRNGSTHCKDGSDETKCACGETSSPSHMCQFRDQPGTDLLTLSNSIYNCSNGLKETDLLRTPEVLQVVPCTTTPTPLSGIPKHPEDGWFRVEEPHSEVLLPVTTADVTSEPVRATDLHTCIPLTAGVPDSAALVRRRDKHSYQNSRNDLTLDPRLKTREDGCNLPDYHPCDNGACIDNFRTCDGRMDCPDGTDETPRLCENVKCLGKFKCDYGGCVSRAAVCDGAKDCRDNSDELVPGCAGRRQENSRNALTLDPRLKTREDGCNLPHYYPCSNGACIDNFRTCDGRMDCPDGTDETPRLCENVKCLGKFKCDNGPCVSRAVVCDGVKDCRDNSDELVPGCAGRRSMCEIPKSPEHGWLRAWPHEGRLAPGMPVDTVLLYYSCKPGYQLLGNDVIFCYRGFWSVDQLPTCVHNERPEFSNVEQEYLDYDDYTNNEIPEFSNVEQEYPDYSNYDDYTYNERQKFSNVKQKSLGYSDFNDHTRGCKVVESFSVEYRCLVDGNPKATRHCKEREPEGTVMKPKCRSPHYFTPTHLPDMKCVGGRWDNHPMCQPDCRKGFGPDPLLAGGQDVQHGEAAQNVAIYRDDGDSSTFVCGGNLYAPNGVATAAHCFDGVLNEIDLLRYKVVLGSHHRTPGHASDAPYAQTVGIRTVRRAKGYVGRADNNQNDFASLVLTKKVEFTFRVCPVYLDFSGDVLNNLYGDMGMVAGWGEIDNRGTITDKLQKAKLPIHTPEKCRNLTHPHGDMSTFAGNKLCAGYSNGTALYKGDSGSGLLVVREVQGLLRPYLAAVTSTSPTNYFSTQWNYECCTGFENLSKHVGFIQAHIRGGLMF
ncbi:low-density lipoprotein receptor-related protein 2-like [Maniola jurtina]|uniref:low-density lipoprotein receptor-related protein 2-like n=1 Tax=Maniola jurtina TaxID=191418 RepID=UPI001E68BE94|nr:low-density lipoprotein receptor-related protein 2-like [Maniola jurtina]